LLTKNSRFSYKGKCWTNVRKSGTISATRPRENGANAENSRFFSLSTGICRRADRFVGTASTTRIGVRYIPEGSVQRDQSRVRVTVQLTDAETGRQVWGDTFEKPMADLFDLQDEIVAQLANTLRAKLFADIAGRAERKPNTDSTDLLLQGLAGTTRDKRLRISPKRTSTFNAR